MLHYTVLVPEQKTYLKLNKFPSSVKRRGT